MELPYVDFEAWLDAGVAEAMAAMPPRTTITGETLTRVRAERARAFPAPWPSVDHRDVMVTPSRAATGVPLRIHRPAESDGLLPCVYWLHAGGYMLGSFRSDEDVIDRWVTQLGCAVVSPDYRLAPEHPFPAAVDDCLDGLAWLSEHAYEHGIDATRIVLVGISAGGGLAASLSLLAGQQLPGVTHQLLMYPMLDDRVDQHASSRIESPIWDRELNVLGWRSYLNQEPGATTVPDHSVPARANDLSRSPETFIGVGTLDIFRDECIVYAMRLLASGVQTELHVYPGAPHGFDWMAPHAPVSQRCRRDIAAFLVRALAPATPDRASTPSIAAGASTRPSRAQPERTGQ